MAVTVTDSGTAAQPIQRVAHLAFDAKYPTGGYSVSFASVGIREAQFVLANPKSGYAFQWDRSKQKLLVHYFVVPPIVLNVNWDGAAFAPLNGGTMPEVPPSTDLSGLTDVEVLVVGQA